jgi:hypothetical protein
MVFFLGHGTEHNLDRRAPHAYPRRLAVNYFPVIHLPCPSASEDLLYFLEIPFFAATLAIDRPCLLPFFLMYGFPAFPPRY